LTTPKTNATAEIEATLPTHLTKYMYMLLLMLLLQQHT
jgi:hypothetical protein